MGWSCASDAGDKMAKIFALHGPNGTVKIGGEEVFFEPSRHEHDDGAITGKVMKLLRDRDGYVSKVANVRIEPDGSVSKGPKWMKEIA